MTWNTIDQERLRALAPEAFTALRGVRAAAAGARDPTIDVVRPTIVALLGGPGAGVGDGAGELSEKERVCVDVAEQFALDVGSTTDAQRAALTRVLGPGAFEFVQCLYAVDMGLRLPAALRQVFGVDLDFGADSADGVDAGLWPSLQALMAAVARLDALDPVTSELVRLRGARAHNCRLCKSRRSLRAVAAGADEETFDRIDLYEASDLPEREKVALRLTDAVIWQPLRFPTSLPAQVRDQLTPAEALEVILDVARNAMNKIAVALGADEAHVTDGVEYFDTDERGDVLVRTDPR